ncbi:hypothetical protein Fcan01_26052 [Folsomia candida]|uniref:Uncharacterized protein n=1 Tax=Folsomia candida TaxID=158441 RepID=A0A226D3G0_FOLCA|nr:hypothetical protein Fcan01_26052 [Folsomia candida]
MTAFTGTQAHSLKGPSVSACIINGRQSEVVRSMVSERDPSYPKFLIFKLENWNGPTYFGGILLPLVQDEVVGEGGSYRVKRFPVRQCSAATLFKVKGRTLYKLTFNFTSREQFSNYSYCGLSRVGRLEDLMIEDNHITLERFQSDEFKTGFELTTAELIRLGVIPEPEHEDSE